MFEDLFIVENPVARPPGLAKPCVTESLSRPESGQDREEKDAPLLHARKGPAYVRQQEQPWHRVAIELSAKGYTCREIAERIGCSDVAVQDILKQPHYQQGLVNQIRKETNEDQKVYELIQANIVKAVKTLEEIMADPKQSAAYRINAAKELLDRRYGKPNQPINRNTDVDLSQLTDAELVKLIQHN